MAKIKKPLRFSDYFKIDKAKLESEGIFDPILNVDTLLFVDPLLLDSCKFSIINSEAKEQYINHFEKIIKLLKASKSIGDTAWKGADQLLDFKEAQGTCLGYGAGSTNGRKLSKKIKKNLIQTAKEIVDIGIDDPDLFYILPLIQEGIGPDFISDFTTSIIEPQLLKLSAEIAKKFGIKLSLYKSYVRAN